MLIDVQLSISCWLKSDKIKGIHVGIEIETGIGQNVSPGLDNWFIDIENAKLKVALIQNVSFSWKSLIDVQ